MSFFAKVELGNDSDFEDASEIAEALEQAGFKTNQRPEEGEMFITEGGE